MIDTLKATRQIVIKHCDPFKCHLGDICGENYTPPCVSHSSTTRPVEQAWDVLDEFKWMKPMCFGRHEAICDTRCAWVVRKRCIELRQSAKEQKP